MTDKISIQLIGKKNGVISQKTSRWAYCTVLYLVIFLYVSTKYDCKTRNSHLLIIKTVRKNVDVIAERTEWYWYILKVDPESLYYLSLRSINGAACAPWSDGSRGRTCRVLRSISSAKML